MNSKETDTNHNKYYRNKYSTRENVNYKGKNTSWDNHPKKFNLCKNAENIFNKIEKLYPSNTLDSSEIYNTFNFSIGDILTQHKEGYLKSIDLMKRAQYYFTLYYFMNSSQMTKNFDFNKFYNKNSFFIKFCNTGLPNHIKDDKLFENNYNNYNSKYNNKNNFNNNNNPINKLNNNKQYNNNNSNNNSNNNNSTDTNEDNNFSYENSVFTENNNSSNNDKSFSIEKNIENGNNNNSNTTISSKDSDKLKENKIININKKAKNNLNINNTLNLNNYKNTNKNKNNNKINDNKRKMSNNNNNIEPISSNKEKEKKKINDNIMPISTNKEKGKGKINNEKLLQISSKEKEKEKLYNNIVPISPNKEKEKTKLNIENLFPILSKEKEKSKINENNAEINPLKINDNINIKKEKDDFIDFSKYMNKNNNGNEIHKDDNKNNKNQNYLDVNANNKNEYIGKKRKIEKENKPLKIDNKIKEKKEKKEKAKISELSKGKTPSKHTTIDDLIKNENFNSNNINLWNDNSNLLLNKTPVKKTPIIANETKDNDKEKLKTKNAPIKNIISNNNNLSIKKEKIEEYTNLDIFDMDNDNINNNGLFNTEINFNDLFIDDEIHKLNENKLQKNSINKMKDVEFENFETDLKDYLRRTISKKRQDIFFKNIIPESLEKVKNIFKKDNNVLINTSFPIYRNNFLEIRLIILKGGKIKKKVEFRN